MQNMYAEIHLVDALEAEVSQDFLIILWILCGKHMFPPCNLKIVYRFILDRARGIPE